MFGAMQSNVGNRQIYEDRDQRYVLGAERSCVLPRSHPRKGRMVTSLIALLAAKLRNTDTTFMIPSKCYSASSYKRRIMRSVLSEITRHLTTGRTGKRPNNTRQTVRPR